MLPRRQIDRDRFTVVARTAGVDRHHRKRQVHGGKKSDGMGETHGKSSLHFDAVGRWTEAGDRTIGPMGVASIASRPLPSVLGDISNERSK
jgi:hypothetical protein